MAWRCSGATNDELIDNLARSGIIKNTKVINALKAVDRKYYAPTNPYQDSPQGIGYQATISAPHMHAHAVEYLCDQLSRESSVVLGNSITIRLTQIAIIHSFTLTLK
jgi:protein-L-isoaspartate(D-aspartate) O-methyltransferase